VLCLNNGFTMLDLLQVLQSNIEELVARAAVGWFALLCADDTERRRTRCPWLDHLLTGEDEYVKSVMLTHPLLRFQAREPIDEAVGTLFRYRGEDHTVGAG
jgi:hypothetical protein